MPGALDFLFNGTPPPSVTGSLASVTGTPDWYQEYLRGIAGQATSLAGQNAAQAVPAMSVSDLTQDQINAIQQVRDNGGDWRTALSTALGTAGAVPGIGSTAAGAATGALSGAVGQGAGSVAPFAQQAVGAAGTPTTNAAGSAAPYLAGATGAVAGPAAQWPANVQQYMSPYTQQVVDNIARLGKRNFEENIMPGVNESMIGSGQFGSTRNADLLGRAARDASQDITGQQAQALEQGYGTSAGIFASDAARAQQQGALQATTALGAAGTQGSLAAGDASRQLQQQQGLASTALGAGNLTGQMTQADYDRQLAQAQARASTALAGGTLGVNANLGAAQQLGALGQTSSALGYTDANALMGAGALQQTQNQNVLNTNFANANNANNYDWSILNNLNSVVRGMQLPGVTATTTNVPVSNTYGPSAVGALTQAATGVLGGTGGTTTAAR